MSSLVEFQPASRLGKDGKIQKDCDQRLNGYTHCRGAKKLDSELDFPPALPANLSPTRKGPQLFLPRTQPEAAHRNPSLAGWRSSGRAVDTRAKKLQWVHNEEVSQPSREPTGAVQIPRTAEDAWRKHETYS